MGAVGVGRDYRLLRLGERRRTDHGGREECDAYEFDERSEQGKGEGTLKVGLLSGVGGVIIFGYRSQGVEPGGAQRPARTRVKENHKPLAIVYVLQQLGTRVGVALCVSWRDGAGIRRLQWMEWKTNE